MTTIDTMTKSFREALPVLGKKLPLNHAGISPQPASGTVGGFEARRSGELPGEVLAQIIEAKARVKFLYGRLLSVPVSSLALTKNTAEGVNFLAQGFPWRSGDRILTVSTEYPSNVYPWWNIRDRGVEILTVPEREGRVDWEEFEAALASGVRLVAISHVEFASGFAFDLKRVSEACRDRGVFLFVDIAQSIGSIPVDLSLVDAAAWPTWKWLMGPLGAGGFYLDQRHLETVTPIFVGTDGMKPGRNYLDYCFEFQQDVSRFEYSTENALAIFGVLDALERLAPLLGDGGPGIAPLSERIFENGKRVIEIMKAKDCTLFSSRAASQKSGILSFVTPGDPAELVGKLSAAGIETACRGDRLRISPHFYNNEDDLSRLERAMS